MTNPGPGAPGQFPNIPGQPGGQPIPDPPGPPFPGGFAPVPAATKSNAALIPLATAGGLFVLALIGYFLAWVSFSMDFLGMVSAKGHMNGFGMATMTGDAMGETMTETETDNTYLVLAIVALVALAAAAVFLFLRNKISGLAAVGLLAISGIAQLWGVIANFVDNGKSAITDEMNDPDMPEEFAKAMQDAIGHSYGIGAYLVLITGILTLALAAFVVFKSRKAAPAAPAAFGSPIPAPGTPGGFALPGQQPPAAPQGFTPPAAPPTAPPVTPPAPEADK